MFEDVRQERSLNLKLSVTDLENLKQSQFTDHELKFKKILLSKNYKNRED